MPRVQRHSRSLEFSRRGGLAWGGGMRLCGARGPATGGPWLLCVGLRDGVLAQECGCLALRSPNRVGIGALGEPTSWATGRSKWITMWMGQYLPHHKDPLGPAFLVGIMATPQTVTQWVSPPLFGRQDREVGIISQVWILKALSWAGSRQHRCAPHPQELRGTLKFEEHGSEAPSGPG